LHVLFRAFTPFKLRKAVRLLVVYLQFVGKNLVNGKGTRFCEVGPIYRKNGVPID